MLTPTKIKMIEKYRDLYAQLDLTKKDEGLYEKALDRDIIDRSLIDFYDEQRVSNIFATPTDEKIGYTLKHGKAQTITIPSTGFVSRINKTLMYLPRDPNCAADALVMAREIARFKYYKEHRGSVISETDLNSEYLPLYFQREYAKYYYFDEEIETLINDNYEAINQNVYTQFDKTAPAIAGLAYSNYLDTISDDSVMEDAADVLEGFFSAKMFANWYGLDIRNPEIYKANQDYVLTRKIMK